MSSEIAVLVLGGFAGGFVNGLTGFGVALVAVPIWALVIEPTLAAPLAAAGGAFAQMQTVWRVRPDVVWRRSLPAVAAGLVGLPVGIHLLWTIDPPTFKLVIGVVLVAYCAASLAGLRRPLIGTEHTFGHVLAGFSGGLLGGLSAFSGPPPIIWASLHIWSKEERRAYIQIFNLVILTAMVSVVFSRGLVGVNFLRSLVITIPSTLVGVSVGYRVYKTLGATGYDRVVLWTLTIAGIGFMASAGLRLVAS